MADVRVLRIKRGQIRGALTRLCTFFDENKNLPLDDILYNQLKHRLSNAEHLPSDFNQTQNDIDYLLCQTAPPEDVSEEVHIENILTEGSVERTEFENRFEEIVARINVHLSKFHTETKVQHMPSASINDISNIKFPTIKLPEFSGHYHEWMEFRDTFSSLIHSNINLNEVQKFYYLKSCLKAEAAKVIQSLEVSASNYFIAWQLLNERFENKRLITNNHLKAIFEIGNINKESHVALRTLTDDLNKHVRCLKALGQPVDSWDTILIYIIVAKLDPVSRREWEQVKLRGEFPTFEEFSSFLKKRCEVLEALNTNLLNKPDHKITHGSKGNYETNHNRAFYSANCICAFCKKIHNIYNCPDFLKLSIQNRIIEVKKHKLCLNCLRKNHILKDCHAVTCRKCHRKHHTLLHLENSNSKPDTSTIETLNNQSSSSSSTSESTPACNTSSVSCSMGKTENFNRQILLATVIVKVKDHQGKMHECRALLDSGSQSNFITNELCERLNLGRVKINFSVIGINQILSKIQYQTNVEISSSFNAFKTNISCLVLDNITDYLPSSSFDSRPLRIPSNIQLADPNFNQSQKVDLLLGASIFWQSLCSGQISLGSDKPILHKTLFGWILAGGYLPSSSCEKNVSFFSAEKSEHSSLDEIVKKFWEIEEVSHHPRLSRIDADVESHFVRNTTRNAEGRFIVKIPFKDTVFELGESKSLALKRLYGIESKLSKNPELACDYKSFLEEYERLGHMSRVEEELGEANVCYLPHHCVIKASSTTTKTRVVFDASAKTSSGLSLNDVQCIGPVIQSDLLSLILRFRQHKYVITADCEKMYRQVLLNESDRDYHRILWRPTPDEEIICFRLNTVTYGTSSASFLATRCIKQLSIDYKEEFPVASQIIAEDIYMDDLLTGAETLQEIRTLKDNISCILLRGGFNLRKWVSNAPIVIPQVSDNVPLTKNIHSSILGIFWNSETDTFQYSIHGDFAKDPVTKRSILSLSAQIFDPLGLLSPITVIPKIIVQKLWQLKLSWDESVPSELNTTWLSFRDKIKDINELKIHRHVISSTSTYTELHGFADSSQKAYGACVYLRCVDLCGNITVNLLCARSRVAPLKAVTLPRLELCAALLLANLSKKVIDSLRINIEKFFYYTDSAISLCWIKGEPQRWKTFVANRVAEIQDLTNSEDWYHVRSADNPADLISRGVTPKYLISSKLWWKGPSWLGEDVNNWPIFGKSSDFIKEPPESRIMSSNCVTLDSSLNIFTKFSSLLKLQRVIAYCYRFFDNVKSKFLEGNLTLGNLSVKELDRSLIILIKLAQRESFSSEIKSLSSSKPLDKKSKLLSLSPFLDQQGVIRVGGRLENSKFSYNKMHPIILPQHHTLTKLIVFDMHLRYLHIGPQQLLSFLRERYWPVSGRNLVKGIVRNCVTCSKAMPKPVNQIMGSLPASRLIGSYPFENTGLDYAGPVLLKDRKTRNYKIYKAYIALFVCFLTKAIHIELVTDMTSECFLSALRRFVARKGKPRTIHSDNARNFVGARNKLDELSFFLAQHSNRDSIVNGSSAEGIDWHFIPPRAPHFGGLWESGVKSIKNHLKKVLGNVVLTFEDFTTVLAQIEAILNSRPLCPLSSDPSDLNPLTPAHFLIGRTFISLPQETYQGTPENRLSLYQKLQRLIQQFWVRWRREYTQELQVRTKWKTMSSNHLQPDSMVVIKEDNLPPCNWKLGRIVKAHPGPDGIIRVVTIRTSSGLIKRPVVKVCPLPIMDSDD